jgi:AraC-like DNA-binding protein
MDYREQGVPPLLDAFVECAWCLAGAPGDGDAAAPPLQRILPDGCVELIFHFRERFHAVSATGDSMPQPASFVVGLLTCPLVIAPAAHVDTMAVRFRPGGAYPFFAVPLSLLTDRAVGLDQLWGRAAAHRIWQQLAETGVARRGGNAEKAAGFAARTALISRELLRRLASVEPDRATASAVGDLVGTLGRARIERVAARAGMTTRHLQRRFADRVGVSPKVLARILRFQRTLLQRAPADRSHADWVRVALECGYADQSHLIHDYQAFAGETPATLLAAESELSTYFTSPARLAALFRSPVAAPPPRRTER